MQHKHMQTSMFDSVDKNRRENKSFKCETRSLTMTHEQTATKNIKKNQHHGKKKKKRVKIHFERQFDQQSKFQKEPTP